MIDTQKWRIRIDGTKTLPYLEKFLTATYTVSNGISELKFYQRSIAFGSYNKDINITHYPKKPDYLYIESSMPKYFYGNNLQMLYPSQLTFVLGKLEAELKEYIPTIPYFETWENTRTDISYNLNLVIETKAQMILDLFKARIYPRRVTKPLDTSVYFGNTLKIYMKQPEFFVNSLPSFNKAGQHEIGLEIYRKCEGVLRFEVELREKELLYHFSDRKRHNKIYYSDLLNIQDYYNILKYYFFTKLSKADPDSKTMHANQVYETLITFYPFHTGARLFAFWKILHSFQPIDQRYIKEMKKHSPRLYYKNLSLLKQANIPPVVTDDPAGYFDFNFPSADVVQNDPGDLEDQISIYDFVANKPATR